MNTVCTFLRFGAVVVCSCLAAGCFWADPPLARPDPLPLSPVAEFMVANTPGTTAILNDPTFGDEVRVTLEGLFTSAMGETCKQATVLSARQEAEVAVICQDATGQWNLAPRIWGQGLSNGQPQGLSR